MHWTCTDINIYDCLTYVKIVISTRVFICFNSSTVSLLVIPDDENRYSSQYLSLFTVQPPETAGGPREFNCNQTALNIYGHVKFPSVNIIQWNTNTEVATHWLNKANTKQWILPKSPIMCLAMEGNKQLKKEFTTLTIDK